MAELIDRYTYRVFWSDEDEEYVALCAEFGLLSHLRYAGKGPDRDSRFGGPRRTT